MDKRVAKADGPGAATDTVVATFDVHYRRYLDPKGQLIGPAPAFAKDRDVMLSLYRAMTLTRTFDYKAVALQRTGQIGTYPSCLGQEAVGVGYASVMTDKDVMFTTYREQAAQLWRGVTITELLQYWGGDERGCDYAGPREDFPVAVPIASQAPHAVGAATAFKLRGEPRVAVCALGDGATSKGDFYESINLAGVWKLPAVFIVINNHWAISLPRRTADRDRDARPEGDRGRHPRHPDRRQRHHRRAPGLRRSDGARAQRRGRDRHRSLDLSHRRSHDRR